MALYALAPVADPSRATFAVDEQWRLYVNPQRLSEWGVLEVAGVLLHEVGHVIRDHAGRARTIAVAGEPARRTWNLAADAEINDDLLSADVTLPPAPVTPAALGMAPDKAAEFYYAVLAQHSVPGLETPDCGPGCHGQGHVEPMLLPAGLSGSEAMLLRRRIAAEIIHAAGRAPGTVAGGWMRWAEATLHPQLDWRRLLTAKIRSSAAAIAGAADYSYARPPRRRVPRVVLPSMRRPVPRVAVIVDTSASVPEQLLSQAWTEVRGCLRSVGIRHDLLTVYAADVHVHRLPGIPKRQTALIGGGGTDMAAAMTAVLATRPTPNLILVITDGLTGWPPERPAADVLIAMLGSSNHRPPPPPWAQIVHIPEPGAGGQHSPPGLP
jgi:predicted metal-dependent peptidase